MGIQQDLRAAWKTRRVCQHTDRVACGLHRNQAEVRMDGEEMVERTGETNQAEGDLAGLCVHEVLAEVRGQPAPPV